MLVPVDVWLAAGHDFVKVLQYIPPPVFDEDQVVDKEAQGKDEEGESDQSDPLDKGNAAAALDHCGLFWTHSLLKSYLIC